MKDKDTELTDLQQKLFDFYTAKENQRQFPPTLRTCCKYMGVKADNTIIRALESIEKKGYKIK